jgi:cobalt-zinc-cadmium efflux system membrane fusion protein
LELKSSILSIRKPLLWMAAVVCVIGAAAFYLTSGTSSGANDSSDASVPVTKGALRLSDAQWATLTTVPVAERPFRSTVITEGKIAIDEDHSTSVFSPYAGRVTKLMVKPGDQVKAEQPLFVVEATDTVQAENDFISAVANANKAQSQLDLAQTQNRRAQDLLSGKAVPLKDAETAQATLVSAQNDMSSAKIALDAAHNRLRILGLSDEAIATFGKDGRIDPQTTIVAPIDGTIVQRKIGPGQYVATGSSDPVFVIGDLSRVWLTAFVRETDAGRVALGQDMSFTVLAYPGKTFRATVDYVAAAIDPTTRRLLVRATIDNSDGSLKPEMFANVTVYSKQTDPVAGVPRDALIYEGDRVRIWVAHPDKTVELRTVKTGLVNGGFVSILDGLAAGDLVVTRGALFIDRAAS